MTFIIIYFLIGLFVSNLYWNLTYREEYNSSSYNEAACAAIILCLFTIFWPLVLTTLIFKHWLK